MIRRRKKMKIAVPVASMGDIAFLLIIFFMLTSQFMKQINIEEAASPDIQNVKATKVSVVMQEDGALTFNGQPCTVGMLEGAVAAAVQDLEDKRVELKIDKRLRQEEFMPVVEALSKAGAKLALVGQKKDE